MNQTIRKYSDPLISTEIRDKVIKGNRSLISLAGDFKMDMDSIIQERIIPEKKVFGLTNLEKYFVIKIYKMTRLPAEDLYDSLFQYFPNLTVGGINECIIQSRSCKV